jgi:hypothetical protein
VGLAIRSRGDQGALFSLCDHRCRAGSELPVHDMRPMEQVVAETLATRRLTLWLVGALARSRSCFHRGIYGVHELRGHRACPRNRRAHSARCPARRYLPPLRRQWHASRRHRPRHRRCSRIPRRPVQ